MSEILCYQILLNVLQLLIVGIVVAKCLGNTLWLYLLALSLVFPSPASPIYSSLQFFNLKIIYVRTFKTVKTVNRNRKQKKLLKLFCSIFFQYKARIPTFLTLPKMRNMFKVNNKDTRTHKVNDKVKNKDTIDVVLATLFLILNTFHSLFQCFYFWIWSITCRLRLFVVLTICACWNQFRPSLHLWKN